MDVLAIDVGGTHVNFRVSGQMEKREFDSGKHLTAAQLVREVLDRTQDWDYEAVSIGYPGLADHKGPRAEPENLGDAWVGFDFAAAFGKPVKVLSDAATQALGSYEGGRMLFLGLGTSVGSTLIADKTVVPLELGQLPFRDGCLADYLGREGLHRLGQKEWQKALGEAVRALKGAFVADYMVLGGGNVESVDPVPERAWRGGNENSFEGGFRLWETAVAPVEQVSPPEVWKLVLQGVPRGPRALAPPTAVCRASACWAHRLARMSMGPKRFDGLATRAEVRPTLPEATCVQVQVRGESTLRGGRIYVRRLRDSQSWHSQRADDVDNSSQFAELSSWHLHGGFRRSFQTAVDGIGANWRHCDARGVGQTEGRKSVGAGQRSGAFSGAGSATAASAVSRRNVIDSCKYRRTAVSVWLK
jgi:polyphosphate glucokinase